MTVRKIGGPGIVPPADREEPEPAARAGEAFRDVLRASPAGAPGAPGLEGVVTGAVEAVRRGEIGADQAISTILEGARGVLAGDLPAGVDIDDVLEYIRETLEGDPAFVRLLEGVHGPGA